MKRKGKSVSPAKPTKPPSGPVPPPPPSGNPRKPNDPYPVETVIRALGLYLDYVEFHQISEYVGVPANTLRTWAKKGIEVDGHAVTWQQFRDLVESKRALASYDRQVGRIKKVEWEEYVESHAEEAASALRAAREYIVEMIASGERDDKGNPVMKASVGDLPKLIQAELLLQGKATERIEVSKTYALVLGRVIAHHVNLIVKDPKDREILLDRIGQDFERVISMGDSEKAVRAFVE